MIVQTSMIAANVVLTIMYIFVQFVVIRVLLKRELPTILVMIVLQFILFSSIIAGTFNSIPVAPVILTFAAVMATALVLVLVRVGLIATITVMFISALAIVTPLTTDLSAPYAPQMLMGLAIIMGLAGYGFWVSLAGQPIFKDMLAEPERAAG